ncbi:nucleoside phosphatase GDA1/CD39 [Cokeromyces recurvatus]|uniref:nucleoside phosphatase GDA1/CD39 n=1 Tax=Cokeromyces recurvatus TaxID=90255 RepID=UPI00221F6FC7|nr:nucleoside phosphatase GDA1/CD39 [Cokeromyces recurvatus]KAI7898429.1 nucleoside phosphatase GDA1/CD39 [Cokeromyces recurvatus]
MIDAGSSGSRVHVYRFKICQPNDPILEDEVFHQLEPGLSYYKNNPNMAAQSLRELLDIAMKHVPVAVQKCTPIAVKATAGLRLLGQDASNKILKAVRKYIETNYPFPIAGEHGVEIMDGKDEGVYAWITVNYLLGKLKKSQLGKSAAVFDLGGGSTQIVFEPTFISKDEYMMEGDHKYRLEYQNRSYELYQHSYLGYGLNEARQRIKSEIIHLTGGDKQQVYYHPCLPENHKEEIQINDKNNATVVQLVGTGAGYTACRGVIERVFNKDKLCELGPCAFDGIYQPPLKDTFQTTNDLYVFSFFYDLTQPLGMPTEFSVRELGELAEHVCQNNIKVFQHIPNAIQLIKNNPDYCLHLTYIYNLLKFGYDIPSDRLVRTAKKIRGAETGWCLGASIAMLDEAKLCQET